MGDGQKEALSCLEESVVRAELGAAQESAKMLIPIFLKCLYDEEVVEEETILDWHSGKLKIVHERAVVPDDILADIKENAKPIVVWLQEADSDDDEEEEE